MTLPFVRSARYRAADFIAAGSNANARHWLAHPADWPERRLVLWGDGGCGKTHLGAIWAGGAGADEEAGGGSRMVDGGWVDIGGAAAADAAACTRIVVDRADLLADETSLLHLLNRCAEAARFVLLIGRTAPARWPIQLPDLASRLRATQAVSVDPPEDSLLRAVLARLLTERQLAMAEPVRDWLLLRLPRTAEALQEAVVRLDGASLSRQQPLTLALARPALADMLGEVLGDVGDDLPGAPPRQAQG